MSAYRPYANLPIQELQDVINDACDADRASFIAVHSMTDLTRILPLTMVIEMADEIAMRASPDLPMA